MSEARHDVVIAACYGAANTGQLAGGVGTELVLEVVQRIAAWRAASV